MKKIFMLLNMLLSAIFGVIHFILSFTEYLCCLCSGIILFFVIALGMFYLTYEIIVNNLYAYILPLIILVPTLLCVCGYTFLGIMSLFSIKARKALQKRAQPTNIVYRLDVVPLSMFVCKFIFLLALLQFVIAFSLDYTLEDENPILAVAIIVGFGAGIGWLITSLIYYFDKKAYDLGKSKSAVDALPTTLENFSHLFMYIINPYMILYLLSKKDSKLFSKKSDN